MARLSRCPTWRFLAAFYRWSQYTQRPHKCPLATILDRQWRHYHATRSVRQYTHPQPRDHDQTKTQTTSTEVSDDVDMAPSKLKHRVRALMRKVPSSVAVVTVAHYDHALQANVPMGVAVSSLSTVTLDPPTISFNIKHPSQTLDAIRTANGLFRVHFLASDVGGARIVELFCRGNHQDAYKLRQENIKMHVPLREDKGVEACPSQPPMLTGDSIRAAMECKLTHEFTVADHVILVAKIVSLENREPQRPTILYIDGSYMHPNGTTIVSPRTP